MSPPRIVIITGAARGLGRALVDEFSAGGWTTIGLARSPRPADYAANAEYYTVDAADGAACQEFWEKLQTSLPQLATSNIALINNAGLYVRSHAIDTPLDTFEESLRSNYLVAVNMTRSMLDVVSNASIVNVISTSALQAKNTNSAYGSAKAGLTQFFRSLQQEFSAEQYRITNLFPGTIRTHGEGPEVPAIEPPDLSSFIRDLLEGSRSFYIAEATLLPPE